MSSPTIQVLLDDGSGTFPTDITTHVKLGPGIVRTLGREDYNSTISAGQLSLTLDNQSSTGTNVFYGSGSTIALSIDQLIRFKVNTHNRFTGYIQQLPLQWPGGGDEMATVALTAVDAMSRFSRMTLGSSFDEEIKADSASLVAYYPLTGGSDTTAEYDASGFGSSRLLVKDNGGPIPVWGDDYASADGTTGVQFTQTAGVLATSSQLVVIWDGFNLWNGSTLHVEFMFSVPNLATLALTLLNVSGFVIALDTSGRLFISGVGGTFGSGLDDGSRHVVSVEATASGTFTVWVDGVNLGSASTPVAGFTNALIEVGDGLSNGFAGSPVEYTIARLNIGSALLSSARIQAHHLAALSDCANETPDQRYTRVANYLNVAVGSLDTNGDTICGPAAQAGKNLADVLAETSAATQGFAYVDADGNLSSINGYTVAAAATPVVSLDANWASEDTTIQNDPDRLTNDVTGQASSSANVIPARNNASILAHGSYPGSSPYTWNVSTDDQAFQLTWWQVNNYGTPKPRAPQLTLDLRTMTTTTSSELVTLGSYVQVTTMPNQSPAGTTLDLITEGLTETVSMTEWALALNTAERVLVGAWVLNDPVWSVLDSTTKPYV